MYRIFISRFSVPPAGTEPVEDRVCIYNDILTDDDLKIIAPSLTLSDNAAGSFEFTVPMTHRYYGSIFPSPEQTDILKISTRVSVYQEDIEIWYGYVVSETVDFYKNRNFYCEGALAGFNDVIQPPKAYEDETGEGVLLGAFLADVLDIHNENLPWQRQILLGTISVEPFRLTYVHDYESTYDVLVNALLNEHGGHLRLRKGNPSVSGEDPDYHYLDYFDTAVTSTQKFEFGKNLLDYTRNWDFADYANVLIPLGASTGTSLITGEEERLTVEEAAADDFHEKNSKYVILSDSVAEYGRIEKVVTFDEVEEAAELLDSAELYLRENQYVGMEIEITAVDLHYVDRSIEPIRFLDNVRCISMPHGIDKLFLVSEVTIPLDRPGDVKYVLKITQTESGATGNSRSSSTISGEVADRKEKLISDILYSARINADRILKQATNGYVSIITSEDDGRHSEALYITSERISSAGDIPELSKYWVWNMNGLGYYNGTEENPVTAITMDGSIVANFITTGEMSADRIRTGLLVSSERTPFVKNKDYAARFSEAAGRTIEPASLRSWISDYWKNPEGSTARQEALNETYEHFHGIDNTWTMSDTQTFMNDLKLFDDLYAAVGRPSYLGFYEYIESYALNPAGFDIDAMVSAYTTSDFTPSKAVLLDILARLTQPNVIFNLDRGTLEMKSGNIKLGRMLASGKHVFEVGDDGYLYALEGRIGSFSIDEDMIANLYFSLQNDKIMYDVQYKTNPVTHVIEHVPIDADPMPTQYVSFSTHYWADNFPDGNYYNACGMIINLGRVNKYEEEGDDYINRTYFGIRTFKERDMPTYKMLYTNVPLKNAYTDALEHTVHDLDEDTFCFFSKVNFSANYVTDALICRSLIFAKNYDIDDEGNYVETSSVNADILHTTVYKGYTHEGILEIQTYHGGYVPVKIQNGFVLFPD